MTAQREETNVLIVDLRRELQEVNAQLAQLHEADLTKAALAAGDELLNSIVDDLRDALRISQGHSTQVVEDSEATAKECAVAKARGAWLQEQVAVLSAQAKASATDKGLELLDRRVRDAQDECLRLRVVVAMQNVSLAVTAEKETLQLQLRAHLLWFHV